MAAGAAAGSPGLPAPLTAATATPTAPGPLEEQARSDIEREQDLLYQLAVLASEQGRAAEARGYLAERVERLEKRGPSKLMEAALRSLERRFGETRIEQLGRLTRPPGRAMAAFCHA